jgi:hypothetical protein
MQALGERSVPTSMATLALPGRKQLASEMRRVANEFVVLEEVASSGQFSEGPEERRLTDRSTFVIHKCYFTMETLLEELAAKSSWPVRFWDHPQLDWTNHRSCRVDKERVQLARDRLTSANKCRDRPWAAGRHWSRDSVK